jgi:hypothetical protein
VSDGDQFSHDAWVEDEDNYGCLDDAGDGGPDVEPDPEVLARMPPPRPGQSWNDWLLERNERQRQADRPEGGAHDPLRQVTPSAHSAHGKKRRAREPRADTPDTLKNARASREHESCETC